MTRRTNAAALTAALAVSLTAVLVACAGALQRSPDDLAPRSEKIVYLALSKVGASDAQRLAILDAYDRSNAELLRLAAESRQLLQQWQHLDHGQPDFTAQVAALAARWGTVNAAEMTSSSVFEHGVAVTLTASQWQQWRSFMAAQARAERRYFEPEASWDEPEPRRRR